MQKRQVSVELQTSVTAGQTVCLGFQLPQGMRFSSVLFKQNGHHLGNTKDKVTRNGFGSNRSQLCPKQVHGIEVSTDISFNFLACFYYENMKTNNNSILFV